MRTRNNSIFRHFSRSESIGKSRMKPNKSFADLLLEVPKGWANLFEHRESLIYISSYVEVSHTVKDDLLSAETVGLGQILWEAISFSWKKINLPTFKHIAVKVVIDSKQIYATIVVERSLFGRLLIFAESGERLSLAFILEISLSPIPWALGLPMCLSYKSLLFKSSRKIIKI